VPPGNPGRGSARNQENDTESDGGEAESSADAQQERHHSAQEHAKSVNGGERESRDGVGERREGDAEDSPESGAEKALPPVGHNGKCRLHNDNGGDRGPVVFGHAEQASEEHRYDRGERGTDGIEKGIAVDPGKQPF